MQAGGGAVTGVFFARLNPTGPPPSLSSLTFNMSPLHDAEIPATWNTDWTDYASLELRFPAGRRLVVNGTLNTESVTLTASNPSQGWAGVRFNPGSGGTWTGTPSDPTVIERVAGDVAPSCLTTPCSETAAVTLDGASPTFEQVRIFNPVPGTYLHGLRATGSNAKPVITGLEVAGMSGSGVYAHAGARPRLRGPDVVLTQNVETAVLASGSGTRPFLSAVQTPSGLRGPVILNGGDGGVAAVTLGRVTFGTSASAGLGYADIRENGGRGLSASGGGDLDAGTFGLHSRNIIYDNWVVNPTGNGLATGTGSSVMARCNWWGTTTPAAFRIGAQSGATFDATTFLTGDPYDSTPDNCVDGNGNPEGRVAGPALAAETAGDAPSDARGRTPADHLAAAMEMHPAEAVALLAALVSDHADTPEAASALSLAGAIAEDEVARPAALALLARYARGERAVLRQAAHQALVVAHHGAGDTEGALASAAALVAMGGDAARTGRAAEVFVLADAERTAAALAALAALEADAPRSDEAAAARLHLAARGTAVPAPRMSVPETLAPTVVSSTAPGEALAVSVRPNPTAQGATVTVSLAEAGAVRVSVHDLLGREVAVLLAGEREAGTHAATVPTLAPGVYTVRAVGAGVQAMARMSVVR